VTFLPVRWGLFVIIVGVVRQPLWPCAGHGHATGISGCAFSAEMGTDAAMEDFVPAPLAWGALFMRRSGKLLQDCGADCIPRAGGRAKEGSRMYLIGARSRSKCGEALTAIPIGPWYIYSEIAKQLARQSGAAVGNSVARNRSAG